MERPGDHPCFTCYKSVDAGLVYQNTLVSNNIYKVGTDERVCPYLCDIVFVCKQYYLLPSPFGEGQGVRLFFLWLGEAFITYQTQWGGTDAAPRYKHSLP